MSGSAATTRTGKRRRADKAQSNCFDIICATAETLAREVIARCQTLARFSEDAGSIRRTFLCSAHARVPPRNCRMDYSSRSHIDKSMPRGICAWFIRQQTGTARRACSSARISIPFPMPEPMTAFSELFSPSHFSALSNGRKLPFAIEVIGFSEEEGVRFGTPFIGSRALVGTLDEELLNRQDAQGISIRTGDCRFWFESRRNCAGCDDTKMSLGYVEFHIEQGPVLENAGRPLGVVEAIAGQSRLEFTFVGHANHAGTTPMNLRHDALAAAAEWIGAVERRAQNTLGPGGHGWRDSSQTRRGQRHRRGNAIESGCAPPERRSAKRERWTILFVRRKILPSVAG